jgi:hypothetical protein
MLAAACAVALITVGITETLSLFQQLRFYPVLMLWLIASLASAAFWFKSTRKPVYPQRQITFDRTVLLYLLPALCIVIGVAAIAILAPPNTWDSMTYHMARVANWVQHRTVAHYQNSNLRQLYLAPMSEFFILQLQILTGSDRLANLVQYFAMIGSAIGVSAIADTLNVSPRGQVVAALFAIALPIGLLEASSTQSDYVAALWVVCSISAGLSLVRRPGAATWSMLLMFGSAVAIALFSKTTTALFLAPFVAWILIELMRKSFRLAGTAAALLAIMTLLVSAGHVHRNWTAFHSPLGPESETIEYKNAIHTPGALISNILRNTCMNLGYRGTAWMFPLAKKVIPKLSGLDVSDPRITWLNTQFDFYFSKGEDDAGNPLHLLMGGVAVLFALCQRKKNPTVAIYALCLLGSGFLFCYELKWQPWITRLQLPLFVITAPLMGVAIDRFRTGRAAVAVAIVLFISTQPYFAHGFPRKLVGPNNVISTPRSSQYFLVRPEIQSNFETAGIILRQLHAKSVGLCGGVNSWEYAVRILLPPGVEILHFNVSNESQACLKDAVHLPDAVVLLDSATPSRELAGYKPVFESPDITVLAPPK